MVKKEVQYYGPEDLLTDYKNYGVHRHSFVIEIFNARYIKMAKILGSDLSTQAEKKDIKNSQMYQDFLGIPPAAYYRRRTHGPGDNDDTRYYVVSDKILNRKEIFDYINYLTILEDEDNEEILGFGGSDDRHTLKVHASTADEISV